jgi:hypothetical protein
MVILFFCIENPVISEILSTPYSCCVKISATSGKDIRLLMNQNTIADLISQTGNKTEMELDFFAL